MAIRFGYTISKPRAIDLDRNNLRKSDEILREMPELQTCIGCGGCTAVCTAGNLTEFNFRRVCPRGINTRGVVLLIKRKLGDF